MLKLKKNISWWDLCLLFCAWVLVLIFVLGANRVIGFIDLVENTIEDFYSSIMLPYSPQNDDIVIVTITENTLSQFDYRSPIDRGFLKQLTLDLTSAQVRAVAFDILFDQKTEVKKDKEFLKALEAAPMPVIVAWAGVEDNLTNSQASFLNAYTKNFTRGYVKLGEIESDNVIRWIGQGFQNDSENILSFPHSIADAIGIKLLAGRRQISFSLGPNSEVPPFKKYEAQFVRHLPPEWLAGKVVLVGADLPHSDRHRTPLRYSGGYGSKDMAGVEIHAHALASIVSKNTSKNSSTYVSFIVIILLVSLIIIISAQDINIFAKLSLFVFVFISMWGISALLKSQNISILPLFSASMGLIISAIIGIYICGRRQRQQKRFISNAFSRYVSPELLKELQQDPEKLKLGGEKREISLIFTDIAGFTGLSEELSPDTLVRILNKYLDGMSEIVLRHGGVIDKYIGDAIMATFNAPNDCTEHPLNAVKCALELDDFSQSFCDRSDLISMNWGITRIGVHTATAIVGNIGGSVRFDYTSVGDAVNTAARLEGINKLFGTRACVSEAIVENCPDLHFRPIGELLLKGKTESLKIYEPLKNPYADMVAYEEAYKALETGHKESAIEAFTRIINQNGSDVLVQFHINRLKRGESGVLIKALEK